MSDLQYWLALHLLPDIGPVVARRLISTFGSPEEIFLRPAAELKEVAGIGRSRLTSITGFHQWDGVRREIDRAAKTGVTLITPDDPAYPEGLRHIHDAPLVLYVKGRLTEMDKYAIAMVGSRTASPYGLEVAEGMGRTLASSGLTVISGMARGIDTASHRGALTAGGRTIAVLGSGIDVPYPAANRGLMQAIETSGAVISEFPFGTKPHKENFPMRNRIISALSLGTVVVEAALDSGSLITVAYALEQGKEVFAVPGNVTSANSRGTNDLIKKGARMVERAEDVIEELSPRLKSALKEDALRVEKTLPQMTDEEQSLYNCLLNGPRHIDAIIREMRLPSSRALSLLLALELRGIIRQTQGKHFSLN